MGMPPEFVAMLSPAEKEATIQVYYLTFVTSMMAMVGVVPVLLTAMKPRSEEREHRAEHILSRAVPRMRHILDYTLIAFLASAVIPFMTATGVYYGAEVFVGAANPFTLEMLLRANMVYLPAMWVMIGCATLLIGAFPKASQAVWGYFAFVFISSFLGPILQLPQWLQSLAPFNHIPAILLSEPDYTRLALLAVVAAALTAAGAVAYSKREMTA
jgi:ABC-2 type transport system permease protein